MLKKFIATTALICTLLVGILTANLFYSPTANTVAADSATWSGERPTVLMNATTSVKYAADGSERSLFRYGSANEADTSMQSTQRQLEGNARFEISGNGLTKYMEICYIPIKTYINLPAYTTVTVKYSFVAGGNRIVNDEKTAKTTFQLFELSDGTALDGNAYFHLPDSTDSTPGYVCDSEGNPLHKNILSGLITSSYWDYTNDEFSTTYEVTYENTDSNAKLINKYFGFWAAKQYNEKTSKVSAFCNFTVSEVLSTARVKVTKGGRAWPKKTVTVQNDDDANETYALTESESESGTYLLTTPSVVMDGRKYSVYVEGADSAVDLGYVASNSGVNKHATTATVKITNYTLRYEDGEGNILKSGTYISGSTVTVESPSAELDKTGYTLKGWAEKDDEEQKILSEVVIKGNVTLVPVWEASKYNVTLNGGGSGTELTEYTYGVGATLPDDRTKQCAIFDGWYTSEKDGEKVTEITATDTGDKVFYARWTVAHTEAVDNAVDPTCTGTGLTEGKHCSVCNETIVEQKTVSALGHDDVNHSAKAPTCTDIGWDAYVTCSRCDHTTYVEKPALGHDDVNHAAKAPTCTDIGWDAYVTCSRCDHTTYVEKPALGHNYSADWTIDKPATCTENGSKSHHCSRCTDKADVTVINALDHSWNDGEVTTAPDCIHKGVKTFTCTRTSCGVTKTEEINAKGHTEVVDNAVAPTCTNTGLTEGKHCSECNEILVAQTVIPMLGHVYDDDYDAECNVCGHVRSDVKIIPEIIEGKDGLYNANKDAELTFTTNVTASKFMGIKIDGVVVDESNYERQENGTKIVLSDDYLKTLSAGKHSISIISEDGAVDTYFTIEESSDNHLLWLLVLAVIPIGLAIYFTVFYKKKTNKK